MSLHSYSQVSPRDYLRTGTVLVHPKEGRGDKVAQSAQRGIQSAMNLQSLCLLLFAPTRSKPTLDGQGDNPSWMPVFSRRNISLQQEDKSGPAQSPTMAKPGSEVGGWAETPGLVSPPHLGALQGPKPHSEAGRCRSGTCGHAHRDGCLSDPLKGNV